MLGRGLDKDALSPFGILEGATPAEEYEPSEKDKKLASALKDQFEFAHSSRYQYERGWELYRLYLKGDQLIVHKATGDIVRLVPEDNKRLRSINNILRPTSRSLVGKLSRNIPTCEVLPATKDFEDTHGALTANALLQYIRRKESLDLRYLEAMEYLPWTGNAIIQVYWDSQCGRKKAWCEVCNYSEVDPQGELSGGKCPTCMLQRETELMLQDQEFEMNSQAALFERTLEIDAQAPPGYQPGPEDVPEEAVAPPPMKQMGDLPLEQDIPNLIAIRDGDVKVRTLDLRDFFIEPGVTTICEARWVCYRPARPVSEIRSMFPEMALFIEPDSGIYTEKTAEVRYQSVDSYSNVEELDDHAYLYEFHEKPTEEYPRGRIIWMCNDRVVRETESPYYDLTGRHPFFHMGWDTNPGEFYREPFIAQAWHRQKELNANETAIREHVELLLKPKWLVPLTSRIEVDEISAQTGQIIKFNAAGGRPEVMDAPRVPPDVYGRNASLINDMRTQASITEQEAGMMGSDPNGRAMAIVSAEADQQLGPITRRNNEEWKQLHRLLLAVVQTFYDKQRTWTVAGPDGTEIFYFSQLNLSPGWDIILEESDGMSSNKALRKQEAIDLLNVGYFTDPATGMPDMKRFARTAGLHEAAKGYDVEATERAHAGQIPEKLRRGEPVVPNFEDDFMIIAEVLLGWLRGPGRREDEMLVQQVRQVWQFYVSIAVAQQMGMESDGQQMMGQTLNPGSGPGGPDQSAPGGSANNPGNLSSGGSSGGSVAGQAGQAVGQADRSAERTARVQSTREG